MSVTVQVRDLDPAVQQRLRDAAKREGISLSALLRRELTRASERLDVQGRAEGLERRNRFGIPIGFLGLSTQEIVASIREDRDR